LTGAALASGETEGVETNLEDGVVFGVGNFLFFHYVLTRPRLRAFPVTACRRTSSANACSEWFLAYSASRSESLVLIVQIYRRCCAEFDMLIADNNSSRSTIDYVSLTCQLQVDVLQ
jgi:hypothetical protein